jgi:predicted Co/Zn/Cd cation transporter (cation efflux family)
MTHGFPMLFLSASREGGSVVIILSTHSWQSSALVSWIVFFAAIVLIWKIMVTRFAALLLLLIIIPVNRQIIKARFC